MYNVAHAQNKTSNYEYSPKLYQALQWRPIGPYRGGRSIAATGIASKPHTFYFGAAGGGLWKTTDGGKTWENVSDEYFKSSSVGAVEVAPSDPNVVYVGMGESAIRNDFFTGNGIYKSTNGGKTWQHMGLAKTHVISDIVIDPNNPSHVYVAALGHVYAPNKQRGVYETHDGGKTWQKILYVNSKTGAIDLSMNPHNPRVLYAAMWQVYRRPWILWSGGPGSGIYKTMDGGKTWTDISHNPGLPKGIMGKIGIDVSPVNPQRVWALIESDHGGLFRSDDGGKTWKLVNNSSKLTMRPWYFMSVFADPQSANTVYVVDLGFLKSVDGGKTFKSIPTPHGDNHDLWINPNNPDIMIEANDGGANVTYNGGKTWTQQDFNTAQIYHVNLDNDFPYHVYGSQQDSGPVKIKNRTTGRGITLRDWHAVAGGESGRIVPVPGKPWITYGGSYIGILTRYNERTKQKKNIMVWPINTDGWGQNR